MVKRRRKRRKESDETGNILSVTEREMRDD